MLGQSHRTLLIVEDNATNLSILKAIFSRGYQLQFADNGEDALRLLREKTVVPDLILLNVVMPGIDGYEACRQLKDDPELSSIPVIFLTGKDSREDESRGLALGAADYITAPFDPAIVKQRVNTHLELKLYRDLLQNRLDEKTSELEESQRVVEQVESRLKGFLRTAPVGLAIVVDRKFVWVNDLVSLYGYTAEEMIGQNVRMTYPSDEEYERVGDALYSQLQDREIACVTGQLKRKDGSLIDVQIRSSLLDRERPLMGAVIVVSDISELMVSRRELEKSEMRLRLVQNLARIGYWELDLKNEDVFWSDSLFQITERTPVPPPLRVDTILSWFPADSATAIEAMLDRHLETQDDEVVAIEVPFVTPEGNRKYATSLSEIQRDDTGRPEFIIGAVQDVTYRKNIEAEMARSFEERDAAFNATSDLVLVLNRDMRVLRANRAVYRLLQREEGTLLGLEFKQIFGQEQLSPDCPLPKTMATLKESSAIVDNMVPGRSFLVLTAPVSVHNGQADYFIVNARDITELQKATECVLQREEQLSTLINATPDFIIFKDDQSRWVLANNAAIDLFQLETVEFFGLTDQELAQKTPAAMTSSFLVCEKSDAECWASGQTLRIEERIPTRHGEERIFDVIKVPVFDDSGQRKGLVVWGRDLTEIKRLQQTTNRATRLAAIGELAAGVAHEINNPNALILYNCDFLKEFFHGFVAALQQEKLVLEGKKIGGMALAEALEEVPLLLNSVSDSALRIKQIVKDLGDFSRQDSRDGAVELNVNEIVEVSVRLVENSIKKATDCFSVELAAGLPVIMGVKGRLEQVAVNLLLNACQALTDRSQAITVATFYDAQQETVVLEVRDHGRGIPEQFRDQVLEPFVTTKRDLGGTGLGLSVSSRIVKEHGGELIFDSIAGKGTTFKVMLPVCREKDK